jgi:hypothetical protein
MISSNGTTATIAFFIAWVRAANPSIRPGIIMSDRDQAQIKALEFVYPAPESRVYYCTWHVLHAMRSHLNTNIYLVLWDKVKRWTKTEDEIEWLMIWVDIANSPASHTPPSFLEYLRKEWLKVANK